MWGVHGAGYMAYFALLGVWMAIAARYLALHGDVGGWALSGEWIPYDGTGTLLGVSYDAVRRCIFAVYLGATLLRCQATRPW